MGEKAPSGDTKIKLYLINRFCRPDFSATSQMLTDLAVGLAGNYGITVVTSRATYNDPQAKRVKNSITGTTA